MLVMPESWNTCQEKLLIGSAISPRERGVWQSTKIKGIGDLKSALTLDMEMQGLELAQVGFSIVLVQHFLTIQSSLPFGMVQMLEYVNFF